MNMPDEAVEAAKPFVASFMERRGFALRGKEADALIGYVLDAAGPYVMAKAWGEGWQHYRKHFSPNDPAYGNNPYRSQS